MANRKPGLGRSISAMFGEDKIKKEFLKQKNIEEQMDKKAGTETENIESENLGKELMVKINLVQPNVAQPRKTFDDEKINELADSINKYGILQPIIVRKENSLYKIIAGERRWRAAKIAGLTVVPIRIKEYDEKTAKEVALIENVQREDLNAVEEAQAYQSLINEYGLTQEEVAKRVSKNRSTIANAMRILKLNNDILELIKTGKLTEGHGRALLSIEDENLRDKIAKKVIEENLSVRDIENLARLEKMNQAKKNKKVLSESEEITQMKIIVKDIEKKLKNKLNTKVKITVKNVNEGKIEIDYYTKEDLDNIYTLINQAK